MMGSLTGLWTATKHEVIPLGNRRHRKMKAGMIRVRGAACTGRFAVPHGTSENYSLSISGLHHE